MNYITSNPVTLHRLETLDRGVRVLGCAIISKSLLMDLFLPLVIYPVRSSRNGFGRYTFWPSGRSSSLFVASVLHEVTCVHFRLKYTIRWSNPWQRNGSARSQCRFFRDYFRRNFRIFIFIWRKQAWQRSARNDDKVGIIGFPHKLKLYWRVGKVCKRTLECHTIGYILSMVMHNWKRAFLQPKSSHFEKFFFIAALHPAQH